MLQTAGYDVRLPDERLRRVLREAGLSLVLSPGDLTRSMGYDPVSVPEAGPEALYRCDLYCDVKVTNCSRVAEVWPRLKGRVLWTRIQGGRPEHVIKADGTDCGDEVSPPCPVLTPNMWYKIESMSDLLGEGSGPEEKTVGGRPPWHGRAYACWPPFVRMGEYARDRWNLAEPGLDEYAPPVCLIHNLAGWGYGALVDPFRVLGVKMYGAGSPDGLIPHGDVAGRLRHALAYVHLKSSDAPGYALYEALAAACPVVCTRRLIWRCRFEDLLIPGETCLVFDRETHDGLTPQDVAECTREVAGHLNRLRDPAENARIGQAGRKRLGEVMWSPERPEDVGSFREFMRRHFG